MQSGFLDVYLLLTYVNNKSVSVLMELINDKLME